jgi:hypothetical protein
VEVEVEQTVEEVVVPAVFFMAQLLHKPDFLIM